MLILLLTSIEQDIVNAYNSYKAVSSEILQYKRYKYFKEMTKIMVDAKGTVLYDLVNKIDKYELIRDYIPYEVVVSYDLDSKTAKAEIFFKGSKVGQEDVLFIFVSPYFIIKNLILYGNQYGASYNIVENGNVINFTGIIGKFKIEAILNRNDYTIKSINYFKNDKKIIEIEYTNTQIVQ
ncbi:MAG: hypothetical protein ABIL49_04385 [candidate division WOR-3 bacterium]